MMCYVLYGRHCCVEGLLLLFAVHIVFFFIDTATTEIYTLSLHDALPIFRGLLVVVDPVLGAGTVADPLQDGRLVNVRSEEHTSELQSLRHLVCRLLLEKKKKDDTQQRQPAADTPSAEDGRQVRR